VNPVKFWEKQLSQCGPRGFQTSSQGSGWGIGFQKTTAQSLFNTLMRVVRDGVAEGAVHGEVQYPLPIAHNVNSPVNTGRSEQMRYILFRQAAIWLLIAGCAFGGVSQAQRTAPTGQLGIAFRLERDSQGVEHPLVISVVPGSLAERVGIRQGDVLLTVNGMVLEGATATRVMQRFLNPNDPLTIVVLRDGTQITLSTTPAAAGVPTSSTTPPSVWLGIRLEEVDQTWGIRGALVTDVFPGSPGDYAGLLPGDIIHQVDSIPVENRSALQQTIRRMSPGQVCVVHVQRGNRRLQRTAILRAPSDTQPPVRRTGAINVLKYAFIHPRTGEVTFAGSYDPSLPGGPIPYDDLLRDALASPYPSFSLDSTPRTQQVLEQAKKRIKADMDRLWHDDEYGVQWMKRLMDLIMNDPRAESDRRRLTQRLGDAFGITAQEALLILNAAADKPVDRQQHHLSIAKVMRRIGWDELADFMANPDEQAAIRELLQRWGRWEEAQAVIQSYQAGQISQAQALKQLNTIVYPALMRRVGVPEQDVNNIIQQYRANRISDSQLVAKAMQKMTGMVSARFLERIINGYTLTPQTVALLYDLPVPAVQPVFKALDRHSTLGWIFYSADVYLKTLCTDPDLATAVPGHITNYGYFDRQSRDTGIIIPSGADIEIGNQLQPAQAPIRVSPDGMVVAFEPAQVRIIGWLKRFNLEDKRLENALKTWTDDHARYLTERYDQFARVAPELHRLREATKVIALVRWAQANGRKLVPAQPTGIRFNPPQELPGFWAATFEVRGESAALSFIFEGGTDYGREVGDGWIQPATQVELTSSTTRQLAASAVLSQQAVEAVMIGDMETARDLAERAARAMTGEIDLTALPNLQGELPSIPDPATSAALTLQALQAIEESAEAVRAAQTALQTAETSTQMDENSRQQLKAQADGVLKQAQAQASKVKDALLRFVQDGASPSQMVVELRQREPVFIPPMVAHAASITSESRPNAAPKPVQSASAPASQETNDEQAIRERWAKELAEVEKQIARTTEQLRRLTREVQSVASQFEEWQKMADEGMESVMKASGNLLIDLGVHGLSKHYDALLEKAKAGGKIPAEEVERVERTKNWLNRFENARTFADLVDLLTRENKTLAEVCENVRDGIGLLLGFTPLSEHPIGITWKYGSNLVDFVYGVATGYEAWKGINTLERTTEVYLKQVKQLAEHLKELQTKANILRQQLAQ